MLTTLIRSKTLNMIRRLLSVADGVGSWSLRGVDPGIYARELCDKYAIFGMEIVLDECIVRKRST